MFAFASPAVLAFVLLGAAPSPVLQQAKAHSQHCASARKLTLVLPHPLRTGETAWLLVKLGAIGHKQLRITTGEGKPLGTLSPLALRSGQAAGIYTIPVPAEDFHGRRLTLCLSISQGGRAPRAPTSSELKSVRLVIRRFKTQP